MDPIHTFSDCIEGTVVKRPSATCKTPYVADVLLEDGKTMVLAHTAALGCCGLADLDAKVIMIPVENKKNVCRYKILFSIHEEKGIRQYIGIDPKLAETLVYTCLHENKISSLEDCKSIQREKTIMDSRFDFMGIDKKDHIYVLEVKNVPLADYVDCLAKEKKKLDFNDREYDSKISYFPDGYRKKQKDTVSPRALKHIEELEKIALETKIKTYLCYVVQREDANRFQTSILDPTYKQAVKKASDNGVTIIVLQIKWTKEGEAILITDNLTSSL